MSTSTRAAKAAQMQALVEAYFESGLTQVRFCESHQISVSTFYYWLKRYRSEHSPIESSLVPLQITEKEDLASGEIEIAYPDGTRIYFSSPVSSLLLRSLIPALNEP